MSGGWLDEVLYGVRKRDDTARGTELRNITIVEASGVDHPASGFENWLLLKSADRKLRDLSDADLDNRIADLQRAASENPDNESLASHLAALRAERTRRTSLSKSAPQGWGKRLAQSAGGRVIFR